MLFKVLQALLINAIVLTVAFDEILGQVSQEMIEQGRTQYQLLREKSNLPQYGPCWKAALDYVDTGCKHLSEETQSDIALHLSNCFLAMSGHETYNCEQDRKSNVRAICIRSMSDRAFNVYTKFFTHTQNICWFLRGQIWQETISDNAFKVGEQLQLTAKQQEELLAAQKESLDAQKRILQHGQMLESVLSDLYISTKAHQEILRLLTDNFAQFQAWAVGEASWLDAAIFYFLSGFFVLILTTLKRTVNARLPLLLFLFVNLILERLLFWLFADFTIYQNLYAIIWYCRNCFILLELTYLIYFAYTYKDLVLENNKCLIKIGEQNIRLIEMVGAIKDSLIGRRCAELINVNESLRLVRKGSEECNESTSSGFSEFKESFKGRRQFENRYNLRSKQNTPDLHC